METAVMAAAIMAARLQWQAGAEVTTMRAAVMATIVVVSLYPIFPLAMVRDDRERR
jgi:hypothetical protein